jgi:hypothetical protein
MAQLYSPGLTIPGTDRQEVYTPEMHNQNVRLVTDYLDELGNNTGKDDSRATDWHYSISDRPAHLVRAAQEDNICRVNVIETVPRGYCNLSAHILKHTVMLSPEGLRAKTTAYYRIIEAVGIVLANQPVSPGYLRTFNDMDFNPVKASKLLQTHLGDPEHQWLAIEKELFGILAMRAGTLKYRAHVRLPKSAPRV